MLRNQAIAVFAKKATVSVILVGFAVFALASMGGGGSKSKDKTVKPAFTPIRTTNGFTLKAGPVYHGSMVFVQERVNNTISLNSIVTYQKGNTIYMVPSRYKVQTANLSQNSNLQMLNLRIKIHK